MFWPIKNSGEVLSKLKDFLFSLNIFYCIFSLAKGLGYKFCQP